MPAVLAFTPFPIFCCYCVRYKSSIPTAARHHTGKPLFALLKGFCLSNACSGGFPTAVFLFTDKLLLLCEAAS